MYHLLVDSSDKDTYKKSSEDKEKIGRWYNLIVQLKPDSATLWNETTLLDYYIKENK